MYNDMRMRKTSLVLSAILIASSALCFSAPIAKADTAIDGIVSGSIKGTQEKWPSGNAGETITGTLSDAGRADYNSPGTTVDFRYEFDPDQSVVDLNSLDFKAGTQSSNQNQEYQTECTVNAGQVAQGQPGYNDFTCQTTDVNLAGGTYAYSIGGNGTVTWNSYIDNQTFTLTGATTSTSGLSVSYGGASSPTGNSITGYSLNVTMNVSGLTAATPITLQLGSASQNGSSAVYTCSSGPWSSGPQTANPSGGSASVVFPVTGLPDGNYCVSAQSSIAGGIAFIPAADPTQVDGNGFFDTPGAIIHVGDAAPLVPGATNNPTANPTGCVTKSDNSNYCLLAPLPGVGDSTGSLDVKGGIGPYFLAIIKVVLGLIGVLSVLMVTIGGIEYMSTVSVGEKEGAKSKITSALFGLLLALTSYIILNTINPNLINLKITIPNPSLNAAQTTSTSGITGTGTTGTTSSGTTGTTTTPPGQIESSVDKAALAYQNTDTSAGPDGGNKACAWAVNNVLANAGVAPLDTVSVQNMEDALTSGRGTLVDPSQAQPGDIVIQAGDHHVGICLDAGCNSVISNSSSGASFNWIGNNTFTYNGSPYNGAGPSRIYRINN